jgi:competence protein ComEA
LLGIAIGALLASVIWGAAFYIFYRPAPPPIVLHPPPTPAPTATTAPTPTPGPITVYVTGAVQRPGLYVIPFDGRVGDAVAAAGGLTAAAAAELLNQAEHLYDGAQVHAPTIVTTTIQTAPPAGVSGNELAAVRSGSIPLAVGAGSASGLININTATADQLDSLPGIGPAKANAIIDNRPYATVDELERVPGIGAATINQLRDLVTVE